MVNGYLLPHVDSVVYKCTSTTNRRTLSVRGAPFRSAILALLALCLVGRSEQARAETTVSGSVRDAAGNPVTHAYVEAIPVFAKDTGGTVGSTRPWVSADGAGTFSLSLAPGRYRLRAKAEADGYPDPSFWLNRDETARFPEIAVGNTDIKDIEVVLGTRGGILTGDLRDAESLKPLPGVKIRIQDARNVEAYVEVFTNSAGHFQYTVPAKPLLISGVAKGYRPASFEGGAEITPSSGGRRELQLRLKHE
jgi:hypothetical protein